MDLGLRIAESIDNQPIPQSAIPNPKSVVYSLYASIISYVETLGYRFTDEEEKEMVNEVLSQVEMINLNQVIADTAVAYRQRRKIKLADSLILATAKHLGADLRTSDIADFKNVEPDVRLVQPPLKSQ